MRIADVKDVLNAGLEATNVPVRRYKVDEDLDDLEIKVDDRPVKLRIVLTSPPGGDKNTDDTLTRPEGTEITVIRDGPDQ